MNLSNHKSKLCLFAIVASAIACGCRYMSFPPGNEQGESHLRFCCADVVVMRGVTMVRLGGIVSNVSQCRMYFDYVGGAFLLHGVSFYDVECNKELPLKLEGVNDFTSVRISVDPGEEMYFLNFYILPCLPKSCYRVSFALPWDVERRYELVGQVPVGMESVAPSATVKGELPVAEVERMAGTIMPWCTNSLQSIEHNWEYDFIRREVLRIRKRNCESGRARYNVERLLF